METPRNPRKNTNGSRINIHEQGMERFHKGSKHTTRQINDVLLKIQRISRKNKQKNKEVSPKIHKSSVGRLGQMTPNIEIRVQCEITRRTRLLSLPNGIRENIRSHDKKGNEKRNATNYRDTTSNKRGRARKPRTRIPKETMSIPGRQEQKKGQTISKTEP